MKAEYVILFGGAYPGFPKEQTLVHTSTCVYVPASSYGVVQLPVIQWQTQAITTDSLQTYTYSTQMNEYTLSVYVIVTYAQYVYVPVVSTLYIVIHYPSTSKVGYTYVHMYVNYCIFIS